MVALSGISLILAVLSIVPGWTYICLAPALVRLTDPRLRADLATTPTDPREYIEGAFRVRRRVLMIPVHLACAATLWLIVENARTPDTGPMRSLAAQSAAGRSVIPIMFLLPACIQILATCWVLWHLAERACALNRQLGRVAAAASLLVGALSGLASLFVIALFSSGIHGPRAAEVFSSHLVLGLGAFVLHCLISRAQNRLAEDYLVLDRQPVLTRS